MQALDVDGNDNDVACHVLLCELALYFLIWTGEDWQ
jgi:hypothetical protein